MLKFIDGFKSSLNTHLSTTDDVIKIYPAQVRELNEQLNDGDHVYLSVQYMDRYEVMKVVKDRTFKGCEVPVIRDSLNRGRKNFPAGTCVKIDWNSIQMHEYICQAKDRGCQ